MTNYRPISILPKLSLVLERILFDFIYPKVPSKISRSQFGFMSKKSTVLHLISFLDNLYKCYDVNEPCFVVYLDFQKAFDTVPHSLLISKLQTYGFDHSCQMLFSSYLTLRKQMVKFNGCFSSKQTICSGIPQGSVLRPLLFLLFINDMPDVVVHSICFLFADDCKVQGSIPTLVQNDINSVVSWSLRNNMRFHPQKTQVLCFGKTHQFLLSQEPIKNVATIDDLGIRVSSNLSRNAHLDWKIAKASCALFNSRSCIPFTINPQTKLRLITSLILPILLFGSQAWCPSFTSMRSLMTFHFRCLKWVVGSSMDYKTCLQRSNSVPIFYQLILRDQTFPWKILHNHLDINLPDYIQLNSGYSLVNRHRRTHHKTL